MAKKNSEVKALKAFQKTAAKCTKSLAGVVFAVAEGGDSGDVMSAVCAFSNHADVFCEAADDVADVRAASELGD